jgi:hypothetical protein
VLFAVGVTGSGYGLQEVSIAVCLTCNRSDLKSGHLQCAALVAVGVAVSVYV